MGWWSDASTVHLIFVPPAVMAAAFLIDYLFGDPRLVPHPVVLIGRVISLLEKILRREEKKRKPFGDCIAGTVLVTTVVILSYILTKGIISLAGGLHPVWAQLLSLYFVFTSLSLKGLLEHILAVEGPLAEGRLEEARRSLSMLVSRDTGELPPDELCRGAVESLAENTADGVVAPLFYAFLGGAPLAVAYKAVNTLDSMLGYNNERYRYFGRAAARLDDVANYIPARLTALFFLLVFLLPQKKWRQLGLYWKKISRESKNHPSPNSGYPEAAAALILDIRLGGKSIYGGLVSNRPLINAVGKAPSLLHLELLRSLVVKVSLLALVLGGVLQVLAGMMIYF